MNLRNGAVEDPMAYKSKEQYQFVTVTKDFMAFGYGRHAWYVFSDSFQDSLLRLLRGHVSWISLPVVCSADMCEHRTDMHSPGRFFAANEIKLILARILLEYDIKMPDGMTERYPNLAMGLDALPDPTKSLMLKKVKASN